MDRIIERALQHWYAPDHKLYGDPLPALMGIVGESGELCDMWKKKLYKPGYVFDRDAFIDELGDCQFYTAILLKYCDIDTSDKVQLPIENPHNILDMICRLNVISGRLLEDGIGGYPLQFNSRSVLVISYYISCIALEFGVTQEQLSELNHAKLNERAANGDGYNRGNDKDEFVICDHQKECLSERCEHKDKHLIADNLCDKPSKCREWNCVVCIPYTDNQCSE